MTAITSPVAPERSIAQRMAALDKGNRIRTERAKAKRELKSGQLSPVSILMEPDDFWEGCRVFDFLKCVPQIGEVKASTWLKRNDISPRRSLAGLTKRQRDALKRELDSQRRTYLVRSAS